MASSRKRITKSVVDKLRPGEIVWDSKLTGFGVRYQRRDKVFIYKCRIGSRQRWFSIGKFGQPWTVETAQGRVRVNACAPNTHIPNNYIYAAVKVGRNDFTLFKHAVTRVLACKRAGIRFPHSESIALRLSQNTA